MRTRRRNWRHISRLPKACQPLPPVTMLPNHFYPNLIFSSYSAWILRLITDCHHYQRNSKYWRNSRQTAAVTIVEDKKAKREPLQQCHRSSNPSMIKRWSCLRHIHIFLMHKFVKIKFPGVKFATTKLYKYRVVTWQGRGLLVPVLPEMILNTTVNLQTWDLSKILHGRIFELKILNTKSAYIGTFFY